MKLCKNKKIELEFRIGFIKPCSNTQDIDANFFILKNCKINLKKTYETSILFFQHLMNKTKFHMN